MRVRDWLDMLRNFLPPVPGLYQMVGDQALLARFRALGQLPSDTLGHALYRFYTDRGFALPGEPKSFPEGWAKHEAYHVLSEYEVNDQGEMLLAAFSGGNSRLLCMDLLMVTLLQFQAGKRVVPGPTPVDELRPAAFFRAVARGASMNVDLLGGQWSLWPVVERPIADLRAAYNVPPLSVQERRELDGWQALIA
jgi:ubiquinone biosynthesis protein Coq4